MNKNIKKGINIKEIFALVLAVIFLISMSINIFAEDNMKNSEIVFPDISGVEKNGHTFIVYDITSLRRKVRLENSDLEYNEFINKLKLRAERLTEGPDKVEVTKEVTKTIDGKDGIVRFKLKDDKAYLIVNEDRRAEAILLDYFYDIKDNVKIYAKPVPVEEKIPLKPSGVNKNIFTQILDFVSLILN